MFFERLFLLLIKVKQVEVRLELVVFYDDWSLNLTPN
jgi:hypothetical protein